jgi:hypothetical protein
LKTGYENTILILFFVSAVVTLFSITAIINNVNAANNGTSKISIPGADELGDPFYEEHYEAELGKPETSNKSFMGNFTGEEY